MELSKADTLYLAMAVKNMLRRELKQSDKIMYERLFYKLSISHNGQRIRETFTGGFEYGKKNAHTDTE